MSSRSAIPSYFLFGEPPQPAEDDFVHIEDLDYRTRPSRWSIRPHQHAALNHLFVIQQGRGVLFVDAQTLAFEAPVVLLVPSGLVHSFEFTPDSTGLVVTLSDGFLAPVLARHPKFAALFGGAGIDVPCDIDAVLKLLDKMAAEISGEQPAKELAMEACLLEVLVLLMRGQEQSAELPASHSSRSAETVARFRVLLEERFREHDSVGEFAARLDLTEAQLRRACRKVTGRSPTQLIQERQIVEAKRALIYSDLSIQEIAASIGFDDPAYFSRFFSKLAGGAPRGFRARRLTELRSGKRRVRSKEFAS